MSHREKLKGLYVITDDSLTPSNTLFSQVKQAIEGGAKIVQLRDKKSSDKVILQTALKLQELCRSYNLLFVLNDKVELAIQHKFDGLHIGKSDHGRFEEIRANFKGVLGVSCYGDIAKAQEFETLGADYVAFGSFYSSPTKPDSNIVPLETLKIAKNRLTIPICAIGGIHSENLSEVLENRADMVAVISDIWKSEDIKQKCEIYKQQLD